MLATNIHVYLREVWAQTVGCDNKSYSKSGPIAGIIDAGPWVRSGDAKENAKTKNALGVFLALLVYDLPRSQRLACRILRELAREPLLIIELMNAGVAQYVSQLLPKLRQISIDRLLEVRGSVALVR